MDKITFSELLVALRGSSDFIGDKNIAISGISIDTRAITKDNCFFAICGNNFDGHNFVQNAFNNGAVVAVISINKADSFGELLKTKPIIVVENTITALGELAKYYRNKFSIKVAAITGSCGKTTTKEMLASILQVKSKVLKTKGNFNNQIGLPLTVFGLDSSYKYCVLELGTSYPGEIKILSNIAKPQIALITNVEVAHLEGFGSKNAILNEKLSLLTSLSKDGVAIINSDDEIILSEAKKYNNKLLTFGIEKMADITASGIVFMGESIKFNLNIFGKTKEVILNTFGKHNVYNALAAAAGASAFGVDIDEIAIGLNSFIASPLRSNILKIDTTNTTIVNDAYNASPTAMLAALDALFTSFDNKNLILILGDMLELGEAAQIEHEKIGLYLSNKNFEKVFFVGQLMHFAYKAYNQNNASCFVSLDALFDNLKSLVINNRIIFLKASRAMRLEKVIEIIKERDN